MTKEEIHEKLKQLFKDLRKQGIISRMNFSCCSSCGGYEITTMAQKRIDEGTPKESIRGCCFYHHQDQQGWDRNESLMLRYGDMSSEKYGDIGLPTIEVGKIITSLLDKYGVQYKWDGNPNSCIEITNPDAGQRYYKYRGWR
jgi:hypothetical protein